MDGTELIIEIVKDFAPTVAGKILPMLQGKKLNQEEANIALFAMIAEGNNTNKQVLDELKKNNGKIDNLKENIEAACAMIQSNGEALAILQKRSDIPRRK